ncbi:hypothetical protein NOG67_18870 [Erwinia persicina]|uniref:hypothetical protein n=1 Tax=Erwinia persicina TaxID=55211 RepID=UPI002106FFF3|nr:hypothetical protein [Erwinia persicina]MCQ4103716.1 hypothetical protein [Erwinia persicina]UTX12380.1 hypothetical protein NOG67_18870 [Erwinia persicina]
MIAIDELKEAVNKIADTIIIKSDDDDERGRFRFKKNNDTYLVYPTVEYSFSKTNMRLSRVIKIQNQDLISREVGELVEGSMNLASNNPCKVVYIYGDDGADSDGKFFITNMYTDKLDQFKKFGSQELRSANLVVLILTMMLEIAGCSQEIMKQTNEFIERRLKGSVTDGE